MDGRHLQSALRLIGKGEALQIRVGKHWMGEDGVVHDGTPPVAASAAVSVASSRYPFSVHGGYPADKVGQVLRARYPAL